MAPARLLYTAMGLTVALCSCLRLVGLLRTWLPFARRQVLADDVLGHVVLLLDLLLHDLLDDVRLNGLLGALDGRDQFFGLRETNSQHSNYSWRMDIIN